MQSDPAQTSPATAVSPPLLQVRGLSKRFGGLKAVEDFDLEIGEGKIVALIGPNGAGKSTTINMLTGYAAPSAGSVVFSGRDIVARRPDLLAKAGLVRTFQNGRLFRRLSVVENVMTAGDASQPATLADAVLHTARFRRREKDLRDRALALLDEFGLGRQAGRLPHELPYGKQRNIEMVRALMSAPRLVMLDEPAAGLNSAEVEELVARLNRLRARNISVLLVEHNMSLVMRVADRIAVLNFGQKIAEGVAGEIRNDPRVIEAYLGQRRRYAGV